ncbi:MAG: ABC transporter ATP-binding protein [Desulfurococcales archaeon]|nr:ABC transporter ATP-binding protein [Desulfurococcales archaeon]
MVEIKLQDVTKKFGKVIAVNNVTLTIEEGGFYVFLGPSGSGKSTLLYLLAGIYKPTSGKIFFDGEDVTEKPPAERNVGLVFQSYALYPHMTVYDNIAYPLKLRGAPKEVMDRKVKEVAEFLHIDKLLERYPHQLSGGQQQRVALARALVKEPKVLLLDEPLSNLDALLRIYIRAELKRIQQDLKITTIYVTHDQAEALAMADKIVVINKGVIQQIGDPDEIYYNPKNVFVATFIGNPPSNTLRVKVVEGPCLSLGEWRTCFSGARAEKLRPYVGREVTVTFRPEDVKFSEVAEGEGVTIPAEVYEVEPLGRESIVTLSLGPEIFVKAVQPLQASKKLKLGKKVYISLLESSVKVYDPETETNLDYL